MADAVHPHLSWLRAHYTQGVPRAYEDLLVIPFDIPDDYAPVCEDSLP